MRGRKLRRAVVGLAVLLLAGSATLGLRPQGSYVTAENYERIGPRMSRAEVHALLGPPGDYATGPQSDSKGMGDWWTERIEDEYLTNLDVWIADGLCLKVYYDFSGLSVGKLIVKPRRVPQGRFDNLLWRAERQWRKWFP